MTTSPGDDDAGTANPEGNAGARRPAAKRPVAPRKPAPRKPRVGTKTSAARNAGGRTAIVQPTGDSEASEAAPIATDLLEPVGDQGTLPEQDARIDEQPQGAEPEAVPVAEGADEQPQDAEPDAAPAAEGADEEPQDAEPEAAPAVEADADVAQDAVQDDAPAVETETDEQPQDAELEAVPAVETDADVLQDTVQDDSSAAETGAAAATDVESEAAGVDPASTSITPETTPGSPPALVLRGVSRSYGGSTAVAGLDLTVPAGSFYGLVGPNGAGKTTTMSMIAGLLRPDRGEIQVAGIDLARNPRAAKAMLGVLPDRLRTFDRLTGRQLLYYYGVLRGLKPGVVSQRIADLARAFDLTEALGRVVSDYSAGMTKKVMLAGAMIHSPRLLVLDEPFEAVDPVSSANILEILSAYVARGGTVLLSSHGMDLIERVCTRVAVIVGGQLLAEGTVDEVRGEMTLEQRFVELSGEATSMEGLEWLHTFSD
ncbi:ATP-binding cassette domain-containing protein [Microbacterium stercoris]|uniref:ATP-binding cassette domain-containing protein n=1 Tax=Microbacterium stercoris TaxID=2820289 RepID=UPI0027DD83E1|nr:ATP-binding cassette domain-containing protein [Microbacterium stercoris]